MSDHHPHCRLAGVALACLLGAGCSMVRHAGQPAAAPVPPPPVPVAASRSSSTPPRPAPPPASAPSEGLVAVHLDPEAMVGQAWVFPSASPMVYGDNRFVFRRDRVEASNARERTSGTWTVERDKLCVTLNSGAWGSACYYVTGVPPGALQIRVLPDGDRVPLKIQ